MKYFAPLLLAIVIACSQPSGINFSGDLRIGETQTGSLKAKEPKVYQLQLDSGSFIYGFVNQITVDVIVKLINDSDEEAGSFDTPARGPEQFSFEIKKSGSYRLEVAPFENQSGDFSIVVLGADPIATDPEKRVDQMMTFYSQDAPGAVIGVMEHGEMIFAKAYGKANLTHNLDFKLNTPTNIGSVSKQFTAFAILLLEKQGLLSIEDDIRKHFPELPDFGEVIRVKNLMNHTNGLREVYNLMPIAGWDGEDKLLRAEVINLLKKQKELQAAPGEEFNYNNSAFILLAELVERLTENKFPEWMKENVFDPLEMNDTYVRSDPGQIIPGASQGYSNGENSYVESGDLHAAYGAGGIYTTPTDLAKWLRNFNDPKLGGEDVINKLVTPGMLNKGDTMTYAQGIGVGEYRGLKRYAHNGADIAHRAGMIYYPEINSGVIALSNHAGFSSGVIYPLTDLFFKDHLEKEEEEENKDNEAIEVDAKTLKQYVGKYKAESIGLVIEYKLEDGNLVAYPGGQSSRKLTPTSDSTFTYENIEASVLFHHLKDDKSEEAVHTQGGSNLLLDRLPPFDPALADLEKYTGKYFSDELETFYTIVVKDSALVAEHRNLKDIKLSPTETDTFSGDIFFMGEVAFKKDNSGKVNAFTVSNGRTKGIYFQRR
jgi:CubicO group peptidase (beta-lactamase class C family)